MPREDPWDRASLDFNVRPDKIVRDITQRDLLIPIGGGAPRLFFICLACGAMLSALGLWTLLMMLEITGHGPGRWLLPIVGGTALAVGLALFFFALHDFKRWREWARNA